MPKQRLLLLASMSALCVLVLWDTPVLLPLQWTVVFIHEAMHALAAMALGADVQSITINRRGGGLTSYSGSLSEAAVVVVGSAGYVGAAVTGGLLFELCSRLRTGRVAMAGLGVLITAAGLAWVPLRTSPDPVSAAVTGSSSSDGLFTIGFCIVAVLVVAALVAVPWAWLRRSVLVVLATGLCLGAVEDLRRVLAASRQGATSDAWIVGEVTGLPAWFWASVWLLVGVAACILGVWAALSDDDGSVRRGGRRRRRQELTAEVGGPSSS